jgi:hypothetical protein
MTSFVRLLVAAALAAAAIPATAAAKVRHFHGFETPSHHIRCGSYRVAGHRGGIRCDLDDATHPAPPRPRSCDFDFGFSFGVRTLGRGRRLCVSDAVERPGHVLAYGAVWRRFGITCRSRRAGLTCRNRAGHGIFVSRDRQRVF